MPPRPLDLHRVDVRADESQVSDAAQQANVLRGTAPEIEHSLSTTEIETEPLGSLEAHQGIEVAAGEVPLGVSLLLDLSLARERRLDDEIRGRGRPRIDWRVSLAQSASEVSAEPKAPQEVLRAKLSPLREHENEGLGNVGGLRKVCQHRAGPSLGALIRT